MPAKTVAVHNFCYSWYYVCSLYSL